MTPNSHPPAIAHSVLKYRDYRLFLAAAPADDGGDRIQSVVVGYQIYEISSDPLQLGFVGLAQFLPMLALILPAGDLADRYNRRTIMMISCLIEVAVAAGFLALTVFKVEALWAFYLILALFGVMRTLSAPASQSLVPLLMPPEHLSKAIAWSSSGLPDRDHHRSGARRLDLYPWSRCRLHDLSSCSRWSSPRCSRRCGSRWRRAT